MKTLLKVLAVVAVAASIAAVLVLLLRPKQGPAYITLHNGEEK